MRMQDKADGDSHEKSMGEFSDEHVQQPQDDRKAVQRRTFTRWMNALLQRCDPPVEVHDLFTDIQDGRILMALLEELSGCKLVRVMLYNRKMYSQKSRKYD
uniref:Calponin-homology (CH) domain-containing protein n=1 Tax=Labrus bergylta TaxID=56723 RepID=A0A3Q3N9C4_9LABR